MNVLGGKQLDQDLLQVNNLFACLHVNRNPLDSRADNFRAIDIMVFEVAGPTMTKNDDQVENDRKKAAKNFRAKNVNY